MFPVVEPVDTKALLCHCGWFWLGSQMERGEGRGAVGRWATAGYTGRRLPAQLGYNCCARQGFPGPSRVALAFHCPQEVGQGPVASVSPGLPIYLFSPHLCESVICFPFYKGECKAQGMGESPTSYILLKLGDRSEGAWATWVSSVTSLE